MAKVNRKKSAAPAEYHVVTRLLLLQVEQVDDVRVRSYTYSARETVDKCAVVIIGASKLHASKKRKRKIVRLRHIDRENDYMQRARGVQAINNNTSNADPGFNYQSQRIARRSFASSSSSSCYSSQLLRRRQSLKNRLNFIRFPFGLL